jgi:hypothetical protein
VKIDHLRRDIFVHSEDSRKPRVLFARGEE